jgi:hypothetical protein
MSQESMIATAFCLRSVVVALVLSTIAVAIAVAMMA